MVGEAGCGLMWHRAIFLVVAFGGEDVPFGGGFAFAFVANADFLLFMAWKCRFFSLGRLGGWRKYRIFVRLYGRRVVRLQNHGTVNLPKRETAESKSRWVLARRKT